MTLRGLKEKYEKAYNALYSTINETVSKTTDVLRDLNRDQLLQGRDADGNLLSPTYLNDPYFKTSEQAEAYFKKKQGLESSHKARMSYDELYGDKPSDVPNLLINGSWFFNHFFANVNGNSYMIASTGIAASDIAQKYPRVYGIAPKSAEFYYFSFIRTAILKLYGI